MTPKANANAPYTMPTGSFEEEYTPVAPATSENPWNPVVAGLAESFDTELKRSKKGYRFTVKAVDITRTKAKISTAANALGYTPKYDMENETKTETRFVLFLVPKISRTVAPKTSEGVTADAAN